MVLTDKMETLSCRGVGKKDVRIGHCLGFLGTPCGAQSLLSVLYQKSLIAAIDRMRQDVHQVCKIKDIMVPL